MSGRHLSRTACGRSDPGTFTQDVIHYLSGVRTLKHEMELHGAQAASSETPDRRIDPDFRVTPCPGFR